MLLPGPGIAAGEAGRPAKDERPAPDRVCIESMSGGRLPGRFAFLLVVFHGPHEASEHLGARLEKRLRLRLTYLFYVLAEVVDEFLKPLPGLLRVVPGLRIGLSCHNGSQLRVVHPEAMVEHRS